jgi:hypothetical protein
VNIVGPGEANQLVPITHISVLEAEAGYGVGGKICEFQTEAGAAAIGDALNLEAIKTGLITLEPNACDDQTDALLLNLR